MGVSVLHEVLKHGIEQNASDWHIREGSAISVRLQGEIQSLGILADSDFIKRILDTMVTPAGLKQFEANGDADFAFEEDGVGRFRVNLHRQRGLVALTLRHVKSQVPSIEDLQLPQILLPISEAKNGIIFVTGSTGSGKSTTLACMIEHINHTRKRHIITVEDPIEFNFEDRLSIIEQREVGIDTVSFNSALKYSLRQDPDIIVMGELRSRDSVDACMAAAETGHLVMTTLHTSNAPQSIDRLLDYYPSSDRPIVLQNLAENLRAIICQRLLPRALGSGVVPINEIMINNSIVKRLLQDNQLGKLEGAIAASSKDGMQSFNQAILKLINEGEISEETGLAYSSNPEALRMNLKGIFLSESGGIVG